MRRMLPARQSFAIRTQNASAQLVCAKACCNSSAFVRNCEAMADMETTSGRVSNLPSKTASRRAVALGA
ncbi:MAG TPA: hypothetical protein VFR19_05105, partial [Hyphomicrobiaceae bacterium]|nr:hypothetical protein [Hyphomicrobiaceae bacterium]